MLKVSLDEGYVFDILSIYLVKSELAETPQKRAISLKAAHKLSKEIEEQIGFDKFVPLVNSHYFRALKDANKETFELVAEARENTDGLAKRVDAANLKRYECKVALQKAFFGTEPTEIKTNA